jgi:Bacterial Ig-like domain (group 3)
VTGSTNMKDVIAAGNANAGIALTGAAATILGSKLIPAPPTTTVTTSWQNIVSMIGGVASLASAIPGLGQAAGLVSATSKIAPIIAGTASAVGGAASIAAGAGGITSSSTSQTLPSAFAHFATTIGDLADGSMEDQLSIGFDTMTDNITSDYGRLSTIGTMTLDSNNLVFFSPNQVAQTISVAALSQAASRNFYLALMPSFYSIHYWPGTSGDATSSANNIPDMGNIWSVSHLGGNDDYYCSAYYLDPQQNGAPTNSGPLTGLGATPANTSVYYSSLAGTQQSFANDYSYWPIDYYVIAGAVTGKGSRTPSIQVIDPSLASNLFATDGLNLPIDEFVTEAGPMSSVWVNAANSNPAGNGNGSVCNARIYPSLGGMPYEPAPSGLTLTPPGGSGIVTTTTLTVPSTSTLDEAVTAKATVTAGTRPISSGQIYFVDTGAIVATEPLDSTGTATASLSNLALGVHSIVAEYSVVGATNPNYLPSTSSASTLTVHSAPPGLNVTLSHQSVEVSAGASSSIAIQVASLAGAAGTVNFSCSGMPSGTSCAFTPQSMQISAGGTGTSSLVISETATTASTETASAPGHTVLSLMPFSLLMMWRIRRGSKALRTLTLLLLLSIGSLAGMVGCGGSGKTPVNYPAGAQTILVTASIGSVTQTVPLSVNFQ